MQQTTKTIPQIDMAELMAQLLHAGVSYRYKPERFAALKGGGHPFASPTQEIETPAGTMIEEAIQPVLSPVTITSNEYARLKQLAGVWPKWLAVQMTIYRMARNGELHPQDVAMIRQLCTKQEWEQGLIDPGYRVTHPFVRLDAIRTSSGFKVMDINTTRPAGVGDMISTTRILHPIIGTSMPPLNIAGSFTNIVKRCINQWASCQHLPGESVRMQIVVRDDDGDRNNFATLATTLEYAGIPTTLVPPDGITNGAPTALIRGRIKEGDPAFSLLTPSYPDERCILSPLYRRFIGNKIWMYLFRVEPFRSIFLEKLGQYNYSLLSENFAEIGFVDGDAIQLPGNRIPLQHADRHSWVFKDPASSSGQRMLLGYTMNERKWKESLWNDVQDGWIAQRFYANTEQHMVAGADGQPIQKKLFTKYGLYIFGDQFAGAEFHARTHPVVHGARNAYFNPVFLDEGSSGTLW